MQKDDEVGKVAQATPIVICELYCRYVECRWANCNYMRAAKALEMFLSMIVDEAHKVTSERGSKRVEAYHL